MTSRKSQSQTKQAQDFFQQGFDSVTKNVDNVSSLAKETLDAVVKSANLAAKGAEKITSEAVSASKDNIEKTISASKDFSNIRSVDQFVSAQTQFSKQMFEQYIGQMTKIGDLFISVSKEVSEPINKSVNSFSEQFAKKAS